MTLARRLQLAIAIRRTSQTDVADACGMTKQQVGQVVSGRVANPGIVTVEKIVIEGIGMTMVEFYAIEDGDGE